VAVGGGRPEPVIVGFAMLNAAAIALLVATVARACGLPCDPPYDWGSEVWYLREVLRPGSGLRDAAEARAFRWRAGPPCADRDAKLHPE
jgi:hypothetical protein